MKLKEFYLENYPEDVVVGNEINTDANFLGLLKSLNISKNIYDYIGVYDSLVRERLFVGLTELIGVDYDYVYNKWIS